MDSELRKQIARLAKVLDNARQAFAGIRQEVQDKYDALDEEVTDSDRAWEMEDVIRKLDEIDEDLDMIDMRCQQMSKDV